MQKRRGRMKRGSQEGHKRVRRWRKLYVDGGEYDRSDRAVQEFTWSGRI
jgi:hypothetical protein